MQEDKVIFYIQESILKKLPESIRTKVTVAGGGIRDKILDEEIKDFDMFVQDKETEDELMKFLKENGKEGHVSSQLANYTFEKKWLQVIRGKYYDISTSEVIDNFDYVHCCAMVTMDGMKTHPEFYKCIATKHIRINKLLFPLNSFQRLQKYVQKGYVACNGTLLELAKSLQTVNFDNKEENALEFYPDGTPRFVGVD